MSTWLFTLRSTLSEADPARSALFAWASTLAFIAVATGILKLIAEQRARNQEKMQAQNLEDAISDAETALTAVMKAGLEQLAEAIAETPHLTPSKIDQHIRYVAKYAVDAVFLLVSERVPGMRTNVFQLTPAKDGLTCVVSSAKKKPGAFLAGHAETQAALHFLNNGETLMHYPDLSTEQPSTGVRATAKYQTFMSFPIAAPIPGSAPRNVYGMLTVDAPHANSFGQRDIDIAELVADILATAFAIAESK